MTFDYKTIEDVRTRVREIGKKNTLVELKIKRSELHPDKNGGFFISKDDKRRYHFYDNAINKINEDVGEEGQLIPISNLQEIIESLNKVVSEQNKLNSFEVEKNFKESFQTDLRRKYSVPKTCFGILACISGFLFTQSANLPTHPIVGSFFDGALGIPLIALLFFGSVTVFVSTWLKEQKEESLSFYLLSEEALKDIFQMVKKKLTTNNEIGTHEIRTILRGFYEHRGWISLDVFLKPKVDPHAMDRILVVQIQRLIDRNVIEEINKPSIEKIYRVIV